jgi:hypothetical protein
LACPICFDDAPETYSFFTKCWHCICSKCAKEHLEKSIRKVCPFCRETINEVSEVNFSNLLNIKETPKKVGNTIEGNIKYYLGESSRNFLETTVALLQALHDCYEKKDYKVLLIIPGDEVEFDRILKHPDLEKRKLYMTEFRSVGTVQNKMTTHRMKKILDDFKNDTPRMKILCCNDRNEDSVTGLDLSCIDCIVSVGDANIQQRLGRLTRLSLMYMPPKTVSAFHVKRL